MTGWRFALSAGGSATSRVAVVFAIVCALLVAVAVGAPRREAARSCTSVEQQLRRRPSPCDDAAARARLVRRRTTSGTPVTLTGRYLADEQLLVRNRPLNGQPGFEVLVPLPDSTTATCSSSTAAGSRPATTQDAPDVGAGAPDGRGHGRRAPQAGRAGTRRADRRPPDDQIATIHLPTIAEARSTSRPTPARTGCSPARTRRRPTRPLPSVEARDRRGAAPVVRAPVDRVRASSPSSSSV